MSGAKAAHDCVERINEQLAEFNTQIAPVISFGGSSLTDYLQVVTIKVDYAKRGKARSMFASYCPFCGISVSRAALSSATPATPEKE